MKGTLGIDRGHCSDVMRSVCGVSDAGKSAGCDG